MKQRCDNNAENRQQSPLNKEEEEEAGRNKRWKDIGRQTTPKRMRFAPGRIFLLDWKVVG